MTLIFYSIGLEIKKNELVQTYPKWGPNYKVEFSIRVLHMPNGNDIFNVLHFTETDASHHNLMVSIKNGIVQISSEDGRYSFEYQVEIDQEYNIIIEHVGRC